MRILIYYTFNIAFGLFINNISFGQPVVSNIRIKTDAQVVKVIYDLEGIAKEDSIYIQIEGRERGVLNVKTVSGDIGRNITSGPDKVIVWNYTNDGEQLNEEIRPTIGIIEFPPPLNESKGGGPINALVSVLAPGIGNILVQPNLKVGLRPLITVAYGGLLGYSLIQKSKSNKQYNLYLNERYERDAQPYYDKANRLHHGYFVTMGMAATILAADVAYTFIRGRTNDRQKRSSKQSVTLQYEMRTPLIGFSLTF